MSDYLANPETKPSSPVQYNDVWQRLNSLYQLSAIDNQRIRKQEMIFLKNPLRIETISKRASPFLHFIVEEVNKRNMPGEIALLPIIESSFKTNAYSSMRASGLWQFVPATGKHFGLKQNWWYDGRRDIYHSTLAALTYLEQLNRYYKGDWLLALAAYNAGAGNINKAIKKNLKLGKPTDYWSLSLPRETFKYVPKLLAIAKIINNHAALGIHLNPIENQPRLMIINTHSQIDLSRVAKMANISLKELRHYNPGFKQWATDPEGPHHLFIPIENVTQFEQQLALLDDKDRVQWYRHKIRSGESLSVIARKYRVSVSVLKTANHLKNSRIRAGKYLMVPSRGDNNKGLLAESSKGRIKKSSLTAKQRKNLQTYNVKAGDSFWKIAHRLQISHKKLASLNGLSTRDTLSLGQVLYIQPQDNGQALAHNKQTSNNQSTHYKVKSGDSLYTISKQFNVSINDLKRWNHATLKKYLKPGQELKIVELASAKVN
ncbi:LysM peptidoglycan-binding domain-containing protein [sulfur-oxidizing endosymbiont of Gigantopelta aegis]|uniref:LysM peptidoglycan-binding domain-containing protein n=1 Tax=sulfur-oxidizing endosymbiont of Gigantopelta aegis TaxID=2794934 RepID=UPI0018DC99B4|nr:LysM peptidoglycan-binding domain-containing protein [sulfur-oxidizing endosymbiont of Gigantopelta aegis]